MIKLIVSDLDGTLLNSKQQISDRTLRAIKQIQRKGTPSFDQYGTELF